MKTKSNIICAMFMASTLGALAHAGPAQNGTSAIPITTTKEAAAVKTGDKVVMACSACKTVALSEAVYMRTSGGEIDDYGYVWLTVGSKHQCKHCGGAITVVRGETTSDMKANCPMCAKSSISCCKMSG